MSRFPSLSACLLVSFASLTATAFAQAPLSAPQYSASGELAFPADTDTWVYMGTTLGGDYNEAPFDPAAPATFGIVQMEPAAFRYFIDNGSYADGTMFLLSFYDSEAKSDPQLQGFVQGALQNQEIHVIDKARFAEGRGFFFYAGGGAATTSTGKIPDGSECVSCHMEHGDFDGTFTQFYPVLRGR